MAGYSFAQDEAAGVESFDEEQVWANNVPPTSFWGLRGLTQTVSAEPLGMGRFNMALFGSYFKQDQDLYGATPTKGTHVNTWRGALSFGVNNYIDLFGVLPIYLLANEPDGVWSNLSELMGGVQGTLPLPEEWPFRIAGQLHFIYGLRAGTFDENEITSNPYYAKDGNNDPLLSYAGYDYFEARKRDQIDLVLKLSQTGLLGDYVKLHVNEGFAVTPGKANDWLFLLAAGLQVDPTDYLTIGLEYNWRTLIANINASRATEPMWLTPSVMYKSPYYKNGLIGMSLIFGVDIRLSAAKEVNVPVYNNSGNISYNKVDMYPLESSRIFGDLVFSFDFLASKRAEMARQARENANIARQAKLTSAQRDSIARKAHEDSLRLASEMANRAQADSIRAKAVADSLAALMDSQRDKARQDSIAQADAANQQRLADSLALAEAKKKLDEERAKRSEAEQMMLSTGMLVLDGVYFITGKAEIQLNSRGYLTTIAKMLVKYPKLRLEIGGHTDATGKFETNMALSQSRAQTVFSFMVNLDPALAQMLTVKGYGPTVPKADNATAAGREINRRVEIKVMNPEVLQEYNP